tara:strand:- start:343 stop:549 length:207 start_codon:yes stop_codon:yes gene_type:complete
MPNETAPTKPKRRVGRPLSSVPKKISAGFACAPGLHAEAGRLAYAAGLSLSQFISNALEVHVKKEESK